MDTTNVLKKS